MFLNLSFSNTSEMLGKNFLEEKTKKGKTYLRSLGFTITINFADVKFVKIHKTSVLDKGENWHIICNQAMWYV